MKSRQIQVPEAASDTERGSALLAAYATAKTMNPTADSPVKVILPPGVYDLGGDGITLDIPYVYLVAQNPAKVSGAGTEAMVLEPSVKLTGNGLFTVAHTANNVFISDIEIENTQTGINPNYDDADPAAYFPDSGVMGTLRRVKIIGGDEGEGNAWATRLVVEYKQLWSECLISGYMCVGGSGQVSGTIQNSTISGNYCVGGIAVVSGTIMDSTISGYGCVGYGGLVSGTILNSTISGNYCVGGHSGTVSGTIQNSTISGYGCVCGGGTVSGTLANNTISGDYCVGKFVFGKLTGNTISGSHCVGGTRGTVSGTLTSNTITGDYCVGGYGGTVSGKLTGNTISGDFCVGGIGGTVSGTLTGNTIMGKDCVGGHGGTVSGVLVGNTISGDSCVGGLGGKITSTAHIRDTVVIGAGALEVTSVDPDAEFYNVVGVPESIVAIGGKYYGCIGQNGHRIG